MNAKEKEQAKRELMQFAPEEAEQTVPLDSLVLCDHATSNSPYCVRCEHGKPHKEKWSCDMEFTTGCKARPWVGRVKCKPYAENADLSVRERSKTKGEL